MIPFVLLLLVSPALCARGAGRAFPVDSENFAVEEFKRINPRIEYDETNFLVDSSGPYATCKYIGIRGFVEVERRAEDGSEIGGYVDDIQGAKTDSGAVNTYIYQILSGWVNKPNSPIYQQILSARRFGCSVRPACSGQTVVSCLFSPKYNNNPGPTDNPNQIPGGQDAYAFTPQQYELAERIMGGSWDRSHLLENLSGYETECAMINLREWSFPYAHQEASKRGFNIVGQYGSSLNIGATEPALIDIIEQMKPINAKAVGCSLISNCPVGNNQMAVVVACIFEV